jgi:hypothetical protein
MRRARWAVLGVVLAIAGAAGVVHAQGTPPTVGLTAGPTSATVQATGPLAAGPTRFDVTREGNKDVAVYVFLLNPGVTFDEFKAAIERDDRTGGEVALGLAWIQAAVALSGRDNRRAVTFNLRPGQTYHVLTELDEEPARGQARQRGFASFTTSGAANGAAAPAPAATVRMQGLRFRGAGTLPRQGVVRFVNNDGTQHFAIAFPLRKGVTSARLRRVLRSGPERAFGRLIAGNPSLLQGLISGGGVANDQEVRFAKAGRYGLICFIHEHQELGMVRIVRVR